MKFLLAFACVLATAMAGPIYDNDYAAPAALAPARPVGLLRATHLAPAAVSSYGAPAELLVGPRAAGAYGAPAELLVGPRAAGAYGAPAAIAAGPYGRPAAASAYGANAAIDREVLALANLALSLPTPGLAIPVGAGYGAGARAY